MSCDIGADPAYPPSKALMQGASQKQVDVLCSKVVNMDFKYQTITKRCEVYDDFDRKMKI